MERPERDVRQAQDLEARVPQVAGETREKDRLRAECEREDGVGEELGGRDGGDRERGRADDDREIGKAPELQPGEDGAPERRGGEQHAPALDPVLEELTGDQVGRARRRECVGERSRIDLLPAVHELEADRGPEQDDEECRGDGDRADVRRRARLEQQPLDLRADDDRGRDEERAPAARDGDDGHRRQDDHRERRRLPRQRLVERLERRRERGAEQADRGDDLRAPEDRDRRSDRRDDAREREREPVRDELVAHGGGRERGVCARDAGRDRAERSPVLAVARTQEEAGAEDEGGGGRPQRDPQLRADPAPIRREHEEEPDAEGHDRPARDRESPCAHEIPVAREIGQGAWRRGRRRRRRQRRRGDRDFQRRRRRRRHVLGRRRRWGGQAAPRSAGGGALPIGEYRLEGRDLRP